MAGLPLSAWILLAAAVGIGLVLEIAFYRAHRGGSSRHQPSGNDPGEPGASGPER